AEGDCYQCVPHDPGIEATALGASESPLSGTAPAEALHTFTLDSGASHCFFRDCTTLTPLLAPVPVRLADPSGGPIVARSSTVLLCPAIPSGSLSGLHLPSFSKNLVSTAALQDAMVTTTAPGGQRVSICTCTRTGRHLATFTRRPGSSLYTLATKPPQVAASAQVSASGQVAPPCSCRLLLHQTLMSHHRLGHPSLSRLRGMQSRLLVFGLPWSLPPLTPSHAPPCLPCVEGRQRAAPHSSFPPTSASLQTLHMDGIHQSFTLPDSPQQNGIAERRIGLGTGAGGAGSGGVGVGGAGVGGAGAVDPRAGGAGGTVRLRPYFVPLLQQVLGVPSSPDESQPPLQPASPLPAPSPYTEQTGGLTERREPASHLASPVSTSCRVPCPRPPPVPSTHAKALRPSSVPLRVPLPPPPESSLPTLPEPEFDRARAACPTISRLLANVVTDLSFEVHCCSESASPPSVGGECALGTDVLEDRQEEFECLVAAVPRFASMLLAPEGDPDAPNIPTPRSYTEAITGTYVDAVPLFRANIVDDMWIFRVKRPPGSPPAFKAGYVARGFSQRQGVDFFQTFSPTLKMATLWVLLHVAAQRDYELHSLDFSTAFLQGSLHEEIWLCCPPDFIGLFSAGLHLLTLGFTPSTVDLSLFLRTDTSLPPFYVLVYVDDLVFATVDTEALTLDRAQRTITLTQSHMVHQVLQRFGFQFSSPQPTPLSTGHSLSAPPLDESVEPSGPYPELVGCLMYPMTCTRPDLAYPLSLLACYVAPGRHQKVH
ncbi:unnamed protein product, partial [Closterium sp. NIES-54]